MTPTIPAHKRGLLVLLRFRCQFLGLRQQRGLPLGELLLDLAYLTGQRGSLVR